MDGFGSAAGSPSSPSSFAWAVGAGGRFLPCGGAAGWGGARALPPMGPLARPAQQPFHARIAAERRSLVLREVGEQVRHRLLLVVGGEDLQREHGPLLVLGEVERPAFLRSSASSANVSGDRSAARGSLGSKTSACA